MRIQVIGSGCPTCQKLHNVVLDAAGQLGLSDCVDYISGPEGIKKIIELGAMRSPLVTIDNHIVMTGFSGDLEKIKSIISNYSK